MIFLQSCFRWHHEQILRDKICSSQDLNDSNWAPPDPVDPTGLNSAPPGLNSVLPTPNPAAKQKVEVLNLYRNVGFQYVLRLFFRWIRLGNVDRILPFWVHVKMLSRQFVKFVGFLVYFFSFMARSFVELLLWLLWRENWEKQNSKNWLANFGANILKSKRI